MKKIFTILLLSGSLLVSGCSDWLDVLPKDKQSTDMYWESSEDVKPFSLRDTVVYVLVFPISSIGESWEEVLSSSLAEEQKPV